MEMKEGVLVFVIPLRKWGIITEARKDSQGQGPFRIKTSKGQEWFEAKQLYPYLENCGVYDNPDIAVSDNLPKILAKIAEMIILFEELEEKTSSAREKALNVMKKIWSLKEKDLGEIKP